MKQKPSPLHRTAALGAALLLLGLFTATLLVGLFGGGSQSGLLRALIFSDVVIPAAIYAFLLITRYLRRDK